MRKLFLSLTFFSSREKERERQEDGEMKKKEERCLKTRHNFTSHDEGEKRRGREGNEERRRIGCESQPGFGNGIRNLDRFLCLCSMKWTLLL